MILTSHKMFAKYVSKIHFIDMVKILGNKWNVVFMEKKIQENWSIYITKLE